MYFLDVIILLYIRTDHPYRFSPCTNTSSVGDTCAPEWFESRPGFIMVHRMIINYLFYKAQASKVVSLN